MKNGQKLKLGDAHVTPRIYSRSTSIKAWGCPRHPLFIQQKYQVLFQYTIFLLLHILCVVLGASFFLFLVWFSLVCCNNWLDPSFFCFGERHTPFALHRTLWFHSYSPASVLFFTSAAFSFRFVQNF